MHLDTPQRSCSADACIIFSLHYLNYALYMVSHVEIPHVCDMWRRVQSWISAILQNLTGRFDSQCLPWNISQWAAAPLRVTWFAANYTIELWGMCHFCPLIQWLSATTLQLIHYSGNLSIHNSISAIFKCNFEEKALSVQQLSWLIVAGVLSLYTLSGAASIHPLLKGTLHQL